MVASAGGRASPRVNDSEWLVEEQRSLELLSMEEGVHRYHRIREANPFGRPEQDLAGMGLTKVAELIEADRAKIVSGELQAGAGFLTWAPIVVYLKPQQLAGAAITATIEAVIHQPVAKGPPTLQSVVGSIGAAVETMFHLAKAKEMDKDLYQILTKTIKHWDGRRARRFYTKVTGLHRAFDLQDRARIGSYLLNHVLSLGWFLVDKPEGRKAKVVFMDAEVANHLASEHANMECLTPMRLPMVIPPADWDVQGKNGGYIYHPLSMFKPVNRGDKPPELGNAPQVLLGVNRLQKTRFKVNPQVFDVMLAWWERGGGSLGVPRKEPIDVERSFPRMPGTAEEIRERVAKRAEANKANALEVGARMEMLWRLRTVKLLSKYPAFYHVWQMDWRGRLYPASCVLSPQGCDVDRGLITFARTMKQTNAGMRWLRIHAANCWANDSLDKEDYDTRERWAIDHEAKIRGVADDPLGNQWWTEAENPWQFLAVCFELCRSDVLTQLPVSIDGTCNGLQHYSAIGCDEVGGRAVNLVALPKPASIYKDVAKEVNHLIEAAGEAVPLPKITHKVVKRGVMTLPYGLTAIGMRDQLIVEGWLKDMPDPYASATYLRDLMMQAIASVVVKAVANMDWLKLVAKLHNEQGIPFEWDTDTGLHIKQDYVVPDEVEIRLVGLGKSLFLRPSVKDRKLYKMKQLNGMCPNIIHSYDAAHLIKTVNASWDHGIEDFFPVHDSYGCHSPLIPVLGSDTREQFVRQYKENPFERIKSDSERRLGIPIPDPPSRGSLHLAGVLDSPYFFG